MLMWIREALRQDGVEREGISTEGPAEYVLHGDAGSESQLFTESVLDEILISMEEENQKKAQEIMEKLDLLELKDRHPMSLSGGQKQRVAIASAIASRRQILIFDEPTSGLDYRHMLEVAGVLRNLQQADHTIYVVTHDLELILECCTDILHFDRGTITEQYTLDTNGLDKVRNYFIREALSE